MGFLKIDLRKPLGIYKTEREIRKAVGKLRELTGIDVNQDMILKAVREEGIDADGILRLVRNLQGVAEALGRDE